MISIEPPPLGLPDRYNLEQAPQLALITALDAALLATLTAVHTQHDTSSIRCWDDANPDDRLAAALIAAARALRVLLLEYDGATHTKNSSNIPF